MDNRHLITDAGWRAMLMAWLGFTIFSLPALAEEINDDQFDPDEMHEYAAWALRWNIADADGTGNRNEFNADEENDYIQWALDWDIDRADLVNIKNSVQWKGARADDRIIRLGPDRRYTNLASGPHCYRATTECGSS